MSVIQDKSNELRYIRRKELFEESKVIGNYYRDIIRSYGIDCHYFKMKVPEMEIFRQVIDQNNLLLNAYGYNDSPCYKISADMITYMEVENDIFNLNKFGIVPTTDVNFYFDSTDFAIALAEKVGQLKEYKIKSKTVVKEIDLESEKCLCISTDFESDIMSGKVCFNLEDCNFENLSDTMTTIGCPFEHTKPKIVFPTNEYLYKCFNYKLSGDTFDDFLAFLDFQIIPTENPQKYIISGNMYGGILFKDLEIVGKYSEFIKPQVGDIVTIDFPDELNREQYEITECTDKQLTTDGINPLLHTYIWKCKAKRFIDAENNLPEKNLANEQINEKMDLNRIANDLVSQKISIYENEEDKIYGGYNRVEDFHDINALNKNGIDGYYKLENLDDGTMIDIFTFANGNRLCTNGYDLFFVLSNDVVDKIQLTDSGEDISSMISVDTEMELQFIKASEFGVYFVNIENQVFRLVADEDMPPKEMQLCLNSLVDLTVYGNNSENPNKNGDSFFKFKNSNILLFSMENHLYCKTRKKLIRIV